MASGYHSIVAGEKPPAATINDYWSKQTVMKFATAGDRDTQLAAVLREGMVCYIDNLPQGLLVYDGTAWRGTKSSTFSPGTPSAGATTSTTVSQCCTITIPDQGVAGSLFVTAILLLNSSGGGDSFDITIRAPNTSTVAGATRDTFGAATGSNMTGCPSACLAMAAGAAVVVTLHAQRVLGTGTASFYADSNLNALRVMFVPT